MKQTLSTIIAFFSKPEVLAWATLSSFALFLLSLLLVPILVVRIPEDYFLTEDPPHPSHPVLWILRNLFASLVVILGLLMLVAPGQGLLTILIGISIGSFPGRRWIALRFLRNAKIAAAVQKLREKAGKPKLLLPDE